MATTGYSGKPLLQKLGIKPGMKIRLVNAPEGYWKLLEVDISPQVVKSGKVDFVHLFAVSKKELEKDFSGLIKDYRQPPSSGFPGIRNRQKFPPISQKTRSVKLFCQRVGLM